MFFFSVIILKPIYEMILFIYLFVCDHLVDGNSSLGNFVGKDLFDFTFLDQI